MHLDKFDTPIAVGEYVIFPRNGHLKIGLVQKLCAKMIKVAVLGKKGFQQSKHIYSVDCLKIDEHRVTMYILKNKCA